MKALVGLAGILLAEIAGQMDTVEAGDRQQAEEVRASFAFELLPAGGNVPSAARVKGVSRPSRRAPKRILECVDSRRERGAKQEALLRVCGKNFWQSVGWADVRLRGLRNSSSCDHTRKKIMECALDFKTALPRRRSLKVQ